MTDKQKELLNKMTEISQECGLYNKQIIIDGVDITNCIHRATNKLCGDIDPYCRCYTGSCKDINNCYYKQLKRKEQECERLNKNSIGFAEKCQKLELEIFHLKDKNNVLERQCEELKKKLKINEEYHDDVMENMLCSVSSNRYF